MTTPDRPSLDGVRLRLARAYKHVRDLDAELSPLLHIDPKNFIRENNGDPTKILYRVRKVPEIDPTWATLVSDALFNFRSAYEHLAYQLVLLDGREPTRDTQFPIHHVWPTDKDGDPYRPQIKPAIRSRTIRDAIERVQPYEVPNYLFDYLWAINHLHNMDKHRLLLVMICVLNLDDFWYGLPPGVPQPSVRVAIYGLKDGDIAAWFDFKGTNAPANLDPHLALTVRINEKPNGAGWLGVPVVDFLDACGHYIAGDLNYTGRFIALFDEDYVAYHLPGGRLLATDLAAGWRWPKTTL